MDSEIKSLLDQLKNGEIEKNEFLAQIEQTKPDLGNFLVIFLQFLDIKECRITRKGSKHT